MATRKSRAHPTTGGAFASEGSLFSITGSLATPTLAASISATVAANDIAGMAVHIGARISTLAEAGDVLVSSTVRDLVVGSGLDFVDRGTFELKGVPGSWTISAVAG